MLLPRFYQRNLFNDIFDDSFFRDGFGNQQMTAMKTDIKEEEGKYLLDIELPGFGKEDINAELKDGYITITAKKEENKEEKDKEGNFIRRERYSGACQRSFYVGKDVKEEDIQAEFKDGILKLNIPKEEPKKIEDQKKQIEIK